MKNVKLKKVETLRIPLYGVVNMVNGKLYDTFTHRNDARYCLQDYKTEGGFGNELKIVKFEASKLVR